MGRFEKLLIKLLRGNADQNFSFEELRKLILNLGFDERISSSHHIYSKTGVDEIINIQPKQNKAKPYQVKQVRNLVIKYKLDVDDNDSES